MFFLHLQSCFKIEIAGKFNLGIRARATHPNIKIRLPVRRSNICWLAHTDVNSKFLLLAWDGQESISDLNIFLAFFPVNIQCKETSKLEAKKRGSL